MENQAEKIAKLNDAFRKSLVTGGKVYLTQGVATLAPEDQSNVLRLVQSFNDFSSGNDPYEEHDFGSFQYKAESFFWKIDYYAPDLEQGSKDPADETKTVRVMTVMLAYEY